MSPSPMTRNQVQVTVKTTAAIINLVVILILDEVYGAVARWLTVLGRMLNYLIFWQIFFCIRLYPATLVVKCLGQDKCKLLVDNLLKQSTAGGTAWKEKT